MSTIKFSITTHTPSPLPFSAELREKWLALFQQTAECIVSGGLPRMTLRQLFDEWIVSEDYDQMTIEDGTQLCRAWNFLMDDLRQKGTA